MEPTTHIGKYEIGAKLGQGGFGEIYVGRDPELGRELAIKVLRPEHTQRAQVVQRFLQEARAAARINHPGIVTVFECGQTDDHTVYIAMELLVGETLAARMKREPLPQPTVLALVRQLASALGAAHTSGIIHRDLKPQNVFLVPDPATVGGVRVKILDFGIAKLSDTLGSNVQTHSMEMMGTPLYMSPEQCKSSANVDARSDIYALGCILFELLSGRPPFDGDAGELIAKHQLVAPPQLRELVTGPPPALEDLVARMLQKSPVDRPQTMDAVIEALDAVAPFAMAPLVRVKPEPEAQFAPTIAPGGTYTDPRSAPTTPFGGGAPLVEASPASIAPPRRRPRAMIAIVGLAITAVGVIAAVAAMRGHEKPMRTSTPVSLDGNEVVIVDVPPDAPAPPSDARSHKHATASGDDDGDDDDEAPTPPTPPIPTIVFGEHGIPSLGKCQQYVEASIKAATNGDKAGATAAAAELAKCETADANEAGAAAKCDELAKAATASETAGDHASALASYEAAYACKPDPRTLALTFMAACNAGNLTHAKLWWQKLAPSAKSKLDVMCIRNHITRKQLDAP